MEALIHRVATHEVSPPETHCFQNRCVAFSGCLAPNSLGSACPRMRFVMGSVGIGSGQRQSWTKLDIRGGNSLILRAIISFCPAVGIAKQEPETEQKATMMVTRC